MIFIVFHSDLNICDKNTPLTTMQIPAILLTVNISRKIKNETTAVITGMRLENMEARLTPSLLMTKV